MTPTDLVLWAVAIAGSWAVLCVFEVDTLIKAALGRPPALEHLEDRVAELEERLRSIEAEQPTPQHSAGVHRLDEW
jgi:hypothetical protein